VILPVGALEQHGLHLPLDTDAEIAFRLAERVAREVGGVVLPPLVYGARSLARSGGGDGFPGTVNLDGTTVIALVRDIVREQARHGVRSLVALLGHGENDPFVVEGAVLGRRDAAVADIQVAVMGWWHVLAPEDLSHLFPNGFPGWDLEHAARVETALMLALAPERVRRDRIGAIDPVAPPPYTVVPTRPCSVPSQGSLSDPTGSTAETGDALVNLITGRLVEAIEREMMPARAAVEIR
jgi:creatinine amidohydrolase